MGKVRVYELARELNIDSKQLVEKVVAGGMDVKNYMSTLDEEAVKRAKEIVSGKISEVVEEKRIKSTVIRRRKKIKIEHEAPEVEVVAEAETEAEEAAETGVLPEADMAEPMEEMVAEAPAKADLEGAEAAEDEEVAPEEPTTEPVPTEVEAEPEVESAPKVKRMKKKVGEPAKIIKRPEEGPLKDVLTEKARRGVGRPVKKAPFPETEKKGEAAPAAPLEPVEELGTRRKREKPSKKKRESQVAPPKEDIRSKGGMRRRKKEVYERADLYEGRAARPRPKKEAKKAKKELRRHAHLEAVPKAAKRKIRVPEFVTVSEMAKALGIKALDLVKKLLMLGVTANINQPIDFDTASVLADEYGYELELDKYEEALLIPDKEDKAEDLEPRPPVVTIMGHVDHGKTSLLDYIRESNIISGESGGITQHIGAYYVKTEGGDIVFLDTPGHEAFTAMRARGAKVTDIIVLVVAADDGVMPQTKEAINHARAATIPIVVAINKIDKAEANLEKVKRELADLDLTPEEWSGDTIFGYISAKTGEGVEDLLSLILLQAEMLELKGNPTREARAAVIEANLDKSKGALATVLIKNGTLRQGDYFVCGDHYGRVRAMLNHRGKKMKSAGPSMPVEIYGISGVPMAGDEFIAVEDEKTAKQIISHRRAKSKKQEMAKRALVSLDDLFERIKEGEVKELNIVLKADVQGSLEALTDSLLKQSSDEVKVRIIHSATGAITESDVMLASASGAIIIGFNVRANPRVVAVAEKERVDVRYYDVIYDATEDIRLAMVGLLEPVYEEHVIGRADIKEIFRIPKVGSVAGCYVVDGHIDRNANIRVLRDDVVVFDGKIASLRRFKEDVKEVQSGYECGIGLENFQDIKPGDVFEVYEMEKVEAEL
jgi:translation initiation factor IF-2